MGHPMRLKLTPAVLPLKFANYDITRGAHPFNKFPEFFRTGI